MQLQRFRPRANNRYFEVISQCNDAWCHHNEELIDPRDVIRIDQEVGQFLTDLRARLEDDQFLDFSLMQRLAIEALQSGHPGVAEATSTLQHVLVDEYQDINPAQDALIGTLHDQSETLFVVGDDDQSIYGWRGADVTRIQTFADRFPGTSEHTLGMNFRSTPLIVESADRFAHAELGAQRIPKNPQASAHDHPSEFRCLWFDHRDDEATWVVEQVATMLGTQYQEQDGTIRGLTPADFAILMRSTRTAETGNNPPRHTAYTTRLAQRDIPFSLEAGGGLFDRPHVQLLRAGFELFRAGQPDRNSVREYFDESVRPLFPQADFESLASLFATWGREIHAPVSPGTPRRRIYPQNLVFDFLEVFGIAAARLDDAIMQDIGVFSRIIQDVEAVYPSVDSTSRFSSILNFLNVVAERGYDTSSSDIVQRPDAVTVSTVHKMKGLEFPVVFVVDVENQRFPGRRSNYRGWLPEELLATALERGAYRGSREEEARLFYTALTRAERFLYVMGSQNGPGWNRPKRPSPFVAHLNDERIERDPDQPTMGLQPCPPARRVEASNLPTSYSDIKYYLRCPKDYHFRKIFGFSPAIPDLFGFGMTVHASIGKVHQEFSSGPPTEAEAQAIAKEMFHLKHVLPSREPVTRPGPFERAKDKAVELVGNYASEFATDFQQKRQIEARFEIPIDGAVVSGAIDLMIQEDEEGNVVDACVIDFKTMEGGEDPTQNTGLEWTELALQVQLYARAARDILGEISENGFVHLLRDGNRVGIPVDDDATGSALDAVAWAVRGIVSLHFPMRPEGTKCAECDFRKICPMDPETLFYGNPPAIHVPGEVDRQDVLAVRAFDAGFSGLVR